MAIPMLVWVGFILFILSMLAIDLGLFHRHAHVVGPREALGWVVTWVSLALVFNVIVYFWLGLGPAAEFLTGYLVEYSLSVDNIFVFIMLFSYFSVPMLYRHRVLFWGIMGALILRGAMIALGATLISRFHWIIYLFGLFLVYTGARMGLAREIGVEPEHNPVLRWFRKVMPITPDFEGPFFLAQRDGRTWATPLLVVLLVVETTDVMFAVDSIPAIFGITRNPFIVFTSNVFAILGLRSLYFLLDGVMGMFRYLKTGLSLVLVFIGVKMLISDLFHIPILLSLGVVAGVLAISILASVLIRPAPEAAAGNDESPRP